MSELVSDAVIFVVLFEGYDFALEHHVLMCASISRSVPVFERWCSFDVHFEDVYTNVHRRDDPLWSSSSLDSEENHSDVLS